MKKIDSCMAIVMFAVVLCVDAVRTHYNVFCIRMDVRCSGDKQWRYAYANSDEC